MISRKMVLTGVILMIAIAVAAGGIYSVRTNVDDDIDTGPIASHIPVMPVPGAIGDLLQALPPSAAGGGTEGDAAQAPATSSSGKAESDGSVSLDGTAAKGRVERIFVRLAQGLLIDMAIALPEQRNGLRYATIEFPAPLANGTTLARALIPASDLQLNIGDVIEMRFAHKDVKGPYVQNIFPVIERDKVTALVAKAGTAVAQDYQRRIASRNAADTEGLLAGPALWKMLPFDKAVKIVRGNGKRELAVFSDPYCSACQAFEKTLSHLDDVSLYLFMLPVIRPDKMDQSKSVWCSSDRAKAWVDLALLRKAPDAAPTCDNPVDAVMALLPTIGIRATPTIIFENGQRGQGSMLESTLRERLVLAEADISRPRTK